MLRGINVSGSSKIPYPAPTTRSSFYNHRHVSFVGRPFPLAEADEHFSRLRRWGFTFLRLLVTWEAIEHDGPGQYDEEYLDYLYEIVRRADDHGLTLFIDPHQDLWSRMSGGDGAPGWTFETIGINIIQFPFTNAAIIHPFDPQPRFAHWSMNYTRFAAATMFTLFFGGNDFAPRTQIEGEPVQDYLQRHYINAFKQVAYTLRSCPNVVGFGSMNEPSRGYIGLGNLHSHEGHLGLRIGPAPTPWQTMLLASGYPQHARTWSIGLRGLQPYSTTLLNPTATHLWKPDYPCVWRQNGVWEPNAQGEPRLLRPHHFSYVQQDGIIQRREFGQDYLRPFINRFARAIRTITPESIMFVETMPHLDMPRWGKDDVPHVVNATHWYDYMTLFLRFFLPFVNVDIHTHRLVFGTRRIQRLFEAQLAKIKDDSMQRMGGVPTLIGEYGIPFNMPYHINFFLRWFGVQARAMDASFQAIEANLLNATLWNYTNDNTNRRGDHWNTEDFSIFSRDQQHTPGNPDSGGRVLHATIRPYPCATAGEPLRLAFNWRKHLFTYTFRHDPTITQPTEIFVPSIHYPHGYSVDITDGVWRSDFVHQRLWYWHTQEQEEHTIHIRPR
jgi:hypothetical protein